MSVSVSVSVVGPEEPLPLPLPVLPVSMPVAVQGGESGGVHRTTRDEEALPTLPSNSHPSGSSPMASPMASPLRQPRSSFPAAPEVHSALKERVTPWYRVILNTTVLAVQHVVSCKVRFLGGLEMKKMRTCPKYVLKKILGF